MDLRFNPFRGIAAQQLGRRPCVASIVLLSLPRRSSGLPIHRRIAWRTIYVREQHLAPSQSPSNPLRRLNASVDRCAEVDAEVMNPRLLS